MVTEPDATNVLRCMASKYASLNSYADTGYVTSTFKSGLVHRRTFCTPYRKPSLFRFAFLSPHPFPPLAHLVTKHVIGFDGKGGYSLTTRPDDVRAKVSASMNPWSKRCLQPNFLAICHFLLTVVTSE